MIGCFSVQDTVSCDIHANLILSVRSADASETQLSYDLCAESQSDLHSNFFHMEGTAEKAMDSLELGTSELESYYDPEHEQSYSRFGSEYSSNDAGTGLGSLVQLPLKLSLDENYIRQEGSELINGSICDIYTGAELTQTVDLPAFLFGSHTSFSMAEQPLQVRLAIDQKTALPVQMQLSYLSEDPLSTSTLPDGTECDLTELTFEVDYRNYGQPIETSVPDGFRDLALAAEDTPSAESSDPSDAASPELKDAYYIESPNHSCGYQITTPNYMAPETISDSGASFYYFYSETDFEIIEYNLWEDFSPQDAAAYTEALPQLLRQSGGYGDLTSSKVNTITIDDKQVQYRTIRFKTADHDLLYNGILVYSWCPAPNGTDVLEVVLWEYNGSDDSSMIQPEEELCFAYHYASPISDH